MTTLTVKGMEEQWKKFVEKMKKDAEAAKKPEEKSEGDDEEEKANPYHYPTGKKGGQFAPKPGGNGSNGRAGMGDIAIDDSWATDFQGGSAMPFLIHNPDGSNRFTPERQQLHDQIVNGVLAGKEPSAGQPVYHILGGGPGSGKTSLVQSPAGAAMRDPNVAVIENDAIRTQLPEYKQLRDAGDLNSVPFTQAEMGYVSARAMTAAVERRISFTVDSTGDSTPAILKAKIDRAHKAGYRVEGHYVTVPVSVAQARAEQRGKKIGRFVPPSDMKQLHAGVSRTLPQVVKDFDAVDLHDNRGEPGTPPALVMHWDGQKQTIDNEQIWQEFLDKAKEAPTPVFH
jgi:predicted ABC-type ATPase